MANLKNGYYWLILDGLRKSIILVQNGRYYQYKGWFSRSVEKLLRPGVELRGPIEYQQFTLADRHTVSKESRTTGYELLRGFTVVKS